MKAKHLDYGIILYMLGAAMHNVITHSQPAILLSRCKNDVIQRAGKQGQNYITWGQANSTGMSPNQTWLTTWMFFHSSSWEVLELLEAAAPA
jgi:hypothetical protein